MVSFCKQGRGNNKSNQKGVAERHGTRSVPAANHSERSEPRTTNRICHVWCKSFFVYLLSGQLAIVSLLYVKEKDIHFVFIY